MEIYSKGEYPSNMLSNFAPHAFVLDGVACGSMEGFLQSLKYKNVKRQREVCALVGKQAKEAGSKKRFWRWTGNVWWQGKKLKRTSDAFQRLIDRAYEAMFENEEFKRALKDSGDAPLSHDMGGRDTRGTILTEYEFISRLLRLRARL